MLRASPNRVKQNRLAPRALVEGYRLPHLDWGIGTASRGLPTLAPGYGVDRQRALEHSAVGELDRDLPGERLSGRRSQPPTSRRCFQEDFSCNRDRDSNTGSDLVGPPR